MVVCKEEEEVQEVTKCSCQISSGAVTSVEVAVTDFSDARATISNSGPTFAISQLRSTTCQDIHVSRGDIALAHLKEGNIKIKLPAERVDHNGNARRRAPPYRTPLHPLLLVSMCLPRLTQSSYFATSAMQQRPSAKVHHHTKASEQQSKITCTT